jgi:hypothetical protein
MYYIGLDVHKKAISYCIKDASGQVHRGGSGQLGMSWTFGFQEYVLFLSAGDARFITELGLRKIAREPRWDCQRKLFDALLKN